MPVHRDTVYVIAVVDRDGNAVSLINSLFFAFGSGIYAEGSACSCRTVAPVFVLRRGIPTPSTRPSARSTRSFPALVCKERPTGCAVRRHGRPVPGNGPRPHPVPADRPRARHPGRRRTSPAVSSPAARSASSQPFPTPRPGGLARRGHRTCWADEPLGGCQAIWIDHESGVLWGASDHRKDGIALGLTFHDGDGSAPETTPTVSVQHLALRCRRAPTGLCTGRPELRAAGTARSCALSANRAPASRMCAQRPWSAATCRQAWSGAPFCSKGGSTCQRGRGSCARTARSPHRHDLPGAHDGSKPGRSQLATRSRKSLRLTISSRPPDAALVCSSWRARLALPDPERVDQGPILISYPAGSVSAP